MVVQLAMNLLGDRDEALDLSQEVFLRVFRTIHRFRGQSSLRTWIYRIAVNQARNRHRFWRRRHRADQVSLDQHIAAARRVPFGRRSRTPDRVLAQKELAAAPAGRARPSAVRPADRDRPARDRRIELRGNRVFARSGSGDRQVAADTRAPGAAPRAPGSEAGMKPLTCAATRRRLEAFHDGELSDRRADRRRRARRVVPALCAARWPISARSVRRCRRRCRDGLTLSQEDAAVFTGTVVNRYKAEDAASLFARMRVMFEDMHLGLRRRSAPPPPRSSASSSCWA